MPVSFGKHSRAHTQTYGQGALARAHSSQECVTQSERATPPELAAPLTPSHHCSSPQILFKPREGQGVSAERRGGAATLPGCARLSPWACRPSGDMGTARTGPTVGSPELVPQGGTACPPARGRPSEERASARQPTVGSPPGAQSRLPRAARNQLGVLLPA